MTYSPSDLTVVLAGPASSIDRQLAALRRQTASGFALVAVVSSGVVGQSRGDAELIEGTGHRGADRSLGLAAVQSRLALFIDSDLEPPPSLVGSHLAAQSRADGPTVICGAVTWGPELRRTSLLSWVDRAGLPFAAESSTAGAAWRTASAANASFPVAELRAAPRTDELDTAYGDAILLHRLSSAGASVRYEPSAVAHRVEQTDAAGVAARLGALGRDERLGGDEVPEGLRLANRFRQAETAPLVGRYWRRLPLPARADASWSIPMGKAFLDAFDAPDELNELKDYLGGEYDESVLSRYEQVVDDEEHSAPDEATFYRTSKYYLYNLTVFAMSGTKRPYRAAIRRQVGPGARLLDYGCGIGADGLRFGDAGYRVDFADFANPSVEYLRWRLGRRDRAARIFDVENPSDVEAMSSDRHDLVYCFDVIEHIDDPFAFLAKLESVGDYVAVNFLEPDPDDVHVHKPLPIRELMAHASAKGIVHYAFHYDRSHFVIYRSRPSSGLRAVAGRARVAWSRRAQTGIPAHLS